MFTRQGHSPGVIFPQILGIELVGTIAAYPPGYRSSMNGFPIGTMIATCMGGLGREIPGSYAEYACPFERNIRVVPDTKLPIATIAALPEMFQTVYGSLVEGLTLQPGESILIRGATSSIGLAAMQLARYLGAGRVAGSTRSGKRKQLLQDFGADEVFIDDGNLANQIPGQFQKILELVGTKSLKDSAMCLTPGGTVCITGIQGGEWILRDFSPLTDLAHRQRITAYSGGPADFLALPWDKLLHAVENGKIRIPVRRFDFRQLQEIHDILEQGGGGEKMVVVI